MQVGPRLPLAEQQALCSQRGSGCGGYATKNTVRPRKAAETPRTNPPAFCLLLEGPDTREHGLPRNKGADEGPGEPEGGSTKTSSRTGLADRQGAGSRPQGIPGVESPGGSCSRAAGSPRDTLTPLATRLWAGGPVLESLLRRLSCPPQGDSSQSSCHRALLYWGLLDGQAFLYGGLLYGGLLYWGLLYGRGFPLWGPPLLGWGCLPLWGASPCGVGLSLLGPSSTKMTADPRHE